MTIDYRMAKPEEAQRVLDFVEANGFNPRDLATWQGLDMGAATAWDAGELVGAIPFQLRPLKIAPGETRMVAHETTVATSAERRGAGLGRAMQDLLKTASFGADWLTVYRELPDSPAYRFYRQNDFAPVDPIVSWFAPRSYIDTAPAGERVAVVAAAEADEASLDAFRLACFEEVAGCVDRSWRRLQAWLEVHPYRSRYRFEVALATGEDGVLEGAAILGVGKLHSDTERIDVLELCAAAGATERLLEGIAAHAAANQLEPIRWPLSTGDPSSELVRRLGWEPGWSFEHMVHPLDGTSPDDIRRLAVDWRYQSLDYI